MSRTNNAMGFTVTKIMVIESLEPDEHKTGAELAEHLRAEVTRMGLELQVDYLTCWSSIDFQKILHQVKLEAETGQIPIIHVECHGDKIEGLEFENGSILSWDSFASSLLPINVATGFNLLTVVSACFGAYFLGMIGAIKESPCYGIVAPSDTIRPSELLRGFKSYYTTFLGTFDAGKAARSLAREKLSTGRWFTQIAELWFEKIVKGYVTNYCTKNAVRDRAGRMYQKLKKEHVQDHVGRLRRAIKKRNRESLLQDYFDRFFIVHKILNNIERFGSTRDRMQRTLDGYRSTGRYVL